MLVDKGAYLSEAKKIFRDYDGTEAKVVLQRMEEIYNYANGDIKIDDKAKALVEGVLEFLFKLPTTYVIPYSFIKSPVGRVLFTVLFGKNEKYYSSYDVTTIMGKTRALISHDLKQGNVIAGQYGGRKNIFIYESDLKTYMASKGIDNAEIELRINLFSTYKKQGMDNQRIREKIENELNERK